MTANAFVGELFRNSQRRGKQPAPALQRHDELATLHRFRAAILTIEPDLRLEEDPTKATVDAE